MDKKRVSSVNQTLLFQWEKILLKQSSGLISDIVTAPGNQQSSTGMPNLDAVVQTPMTLNTNTLMILQ